MAAVRINSRKIESRNGRRRHLFEGELHSDTFGIVFSGDGLILNLSNGERGCSIIFDDETTAYIAKRFADRAEVRASKGKAA